MRFDLKIALMTVFGTQISAARKLRINEGRLSHLVRGHDDPNERERRLLEKALGRDYFAKEGEGPRAA